MSETDAQDIARDLTIIAGSFVTLAPHSRATLVEAGSILCRLAAENAALRTERDAARRIYGEAHALADHWADKHDAATARAATLAEEVERLREALGFYACNADCDECDGNHDQVWCGQQARAALAPAATAPRDAAGGA